MVKEIIRLHRYETTEGAMIAISFPMAEPYKSLVKQLSGRRWCEVNKWVYVKNTPGNLKEIFDRFRGIAWIDSREFLSHALEQNEDVRIINNIQKKLTYLHFPHGAKAEWIDEIMKIKNFFHVFKTGDWAIPGTNENFLKVTGYFVEQGCSVKVKNIGCGSILEKKEEISGQHLSSCGSTYLQKYKQMLSLKRVSHATCKCYISMFLRFLRYFNNKDINQLNKDEIMDYLLWEIDRNSISMAVQNQLVNAIKYYYEKVLGKPREIYDLPRPRFGKPEPVVLNNQELSAIFAGIKNVKHRCIISLIFSAGLRRHELINLRLQDIDMERKIIHVHGGKGNKDRISILAEITEKHLEDYLKQYKPDYWLFEGANGKQYSAESIWKIFDRLKKQSSIEKRGNVHLLRHTFATNLLEAGTDVRYIQKLLGHSSLKTTEIYTHIANNDLAKIKSPIDRLSILDPQSQKIHVADNQQQTEASEEFYNKLTNYQPTL